MGERYISSSLTAILIATMPLFVALLSLRLSTADQPTGLRLLGLVIGLGGVVALLGVDVAGRPAELLGAALILVATLGYAAAPTRALRPRTRHPFTPPALRAANVFRLPEGDQAGRANGGNGVAPRHRGN